MTKTVRVRIAVAVAPGGQWNSFGFGQEGTPPTDADDREAMGNACEVYDGNGEALFGEARYWIEADLPIPEPVTVEGEVKAG